MSSSDSSFSVCAVSRRILCLKSLTYPLPSSPPPSLRQQQHHQRQLHQQQELHHLHLQKERMQACLNPQKLTNAVSLFPPIVSRISYLVDILTLELRDQSGEALIIGFNSNRVEDLLDVLRGGRGVTTDGKEEVGCEVLHFAG